MWSGRPLLVAESLVFFVCTVNGFSAGPPDKSCFTLYPKHDGMQAMSTPPPYKVKVNSSSYSKEGDVLEITLSGDPGHHFKGFMLVANRVYAGQVSMEEVVGQFMTPSDKGKFLKWYPENQNQSNCIGHKNNDVVETLSVTWSAPDPASAGDVIFRASFLSEMYTFWVDVRSDRITTESRLDTVPSNKPQVKTVVGVPRDITDGCGSRKGCVGFPRHCQGTWCHHVVTWTPEVDYVKFEVLSESPAYVSLAISQDQYMGDDHSMTCVSKNHFMHIQSGYNPGYFNERHIIDQFWDIEVTRDDGRLYCSWKTNYQVNLTLMNQQKNFYNKIFDYKRKWHVQLAWGDIYYGGDTLGKHHEYPFVSASRVSFSETESALPHGLPILQKLHGFFMILAWILCCGVGVITARYLKDAFGNKMIMGAKIWFQVHRAAMILCGVFTISGFVLIFVSLKAWTEYNNTHGVVGTVMTGLMIIQIIMGMLRPGPNSEARPAFNWGHWGLGKATQILSAATLILALYGLTIYSQLRDRLLIVFSTWIGVQILFEIVGFETFKTVAIGALWLHQNQYELEDGTKESKKSGITSDENSPFFFKAQFILYLISIVVITLAALIILLLY